MRPSLITALADGTERQYLLNAPVVTLGREPENDIPIRSDSISRSHAEIRVASEQSYLRDLGSTNGTILNGRNIGTCEAPLSHGDTIQLGGVTLKFIHATGRTTDKPSAETTRHLSDSAGSTQVHTLLNATSSAADVTAIEASLLQVVVTERAARLCIRDSGRTRDHLLQADMLIGRSPECDIQVQDPHCSAQHAKISKTSDDRYSVTDLSSTNGLYVNGLRCRTHTLFEGDTLRIGDATLTFSDPNQPPHVSPTAGRRPVVLIPGFAGSELNCGDEVLWPNTARLLSTSEAQLIDDWQQPLTVGRAVREIAVFPGLFRNDSFGWLVRYLEVELGYTLDVDLLEGSYDWRQSNLTSAGALAEKIRTWRERRADPTERVVLIAHSMGGLLARLYLTLRGSEDSVERIIFLGTPQHGSSVALSALLGGGGILPFGLSLKRIDRLVREFPSLYQLLPVGHAAWWDIGEPFSPLSDDVDWLPSEHDDKLAEAIRARELLDADLPDSIPVTSIFGYGQKTLEAVVVSRHEGTVRVIDQRYDNAGDGIVTETSAIWGGSDIHPVRQQHGSLFSDPDVLRRLRFELVERSGVRVDAIPGEQKSVNE